MNPKALNELINNLRVFYRCPSCSAEYHADDIRFLGMMLGSLAIISGAKLATALLVLGVPVIDALWSVVRRLAQGKSPFTADRGHFHYILLDAGLSQRQAVLLIYALSLAFGLFALLGDGLEKLLALLVLVVVVALLMITFTLTRKRHAKRA